MGSRRRDATSSCYDSLLSRIEIATVVHARLRASFSGRYRIVYASCTPDDAVYATHHSFPSVPPEHLLVPQRPKQPELVPLRRRLDRRRRRTSRLRRRRRALQPRVRSHPLRVSPRPFRAPVPFPVEIESDGRREGQRSFESIRVRSEVPGRARLGQNSRVVGRRQRQLCVASTVGRAPPDAGVLPQFILLHDVIRRHLVVPLSRSDPRLGREPPVRRVHAAVSVFPRRDASPVVVRRDEPGLERVAVVLHRPRRVRGRHRGGRVVMEHPVARRSLALAAARVARDEVARPRGSSRLSDSKSGGLHFFSFTGSRWLVRVRFATSAHASTPSTCLLREYRPSASA